MELTVLLFLDEEIKEQPDGRQTLLDRGVTHHRQFALLGAVGPELRLHVGRDVRTTCYCSIDAPPVRVRKEMLESARISQYGVWRESQIFLVR